MCSTQHVARTDTHKELPTAQPMREVAPNDLSGPGYTLHKHDIRRGTRGRGSVRYNWGKLI